MSKIDDYIKSIGEEEMDSAGLEPMFASIPQYLPDVDTTLAVGCGTGTELNYLPGEVRGIDINPIHKSEQIDTGDMHDLPYKDNEFELVYIRDAFEHSVAPIVAISELARVSSKYVCIILPDEVWTESHWHLIIPTMRQLMNLAEKVGLRLLRVRDIRMIINKGGFFLLHNRIYVFEKVDKGDKKET